MILLAIFGALMFVAIIVYIIVVRKKNRTRENNNHFVISEGLSDIADKLF